MRFTLFDGGQQSSGPRVRADQQQASSSSVHSHYERLQDEDRLGAFRQAIGLTVEPGMRVVDLSGGTGILSSFAARQGANVSFVEHDPQVAELAGMILKHNGLDDRVSVVTRDPFEYLPREPVDVVICDMLRVAMLGRPQLQVIESFKHRYCEAFGSQLPLFLPESAVLMAQPIQQSFGFSGYWAPVPMFQSPRLRNDRTDELAELTPYATIVYSERFAKRFDRVEKFTLDESGTLNAIRFVTENVIALDSKKGRAVTWPSQSIVLPMGTPLRVRAGDMVNVAFSYNAGDPVDQLCSSMLVGPAHSGLIAKRAA